MRACWAGPKREGEPCLKVELNRPIPGGQSARFGAQLEGSQGVGGLPAPGRLSSARGLVAFFLLHAGDWIMTRAEGLSFRKKSVVA